MPEASDTMVAQPVIDAPDPMTERIATPTDDGTVRRYADFATVGDALDYAALGRRGLNFHDPRGRLARVYP
ncbi:MAG: hypothetical protein ABL874_05210, partial [Sphingopyxis sp.]